MLWGTCVKWRMEDVCEGVNYVSHRERRNIVACRTEHTYAGVHADGEGGRIVMCTTECMKLPEKKHWKHEATRAARAGTDHVSKGAGRAEGMHDRYWVVI